MRYASAAAFRAALEQRLLTQSRETGTSLVRLRKAVVFDRLLARFVTAARGRWVLKGGLALDFRLGSRTRTTKDMDIARPDDEETATADFIAAQAVDLGDFFTFAVEKARDLGEGAEGALRYHVRAELAGRVFEEVIVDVGFSDPLLGPPDHRGSAGVSVASDVRVEPGAEAVHPPAQRVDPPAEVDGERVDPPAEVDGERVDPSVQPGALGIDPGAERVDPPAQVEDARDQRRGEDADGGPGDSHSANLAPATDIASRVSFHGQTPLPVQPLNDSSVHAPIVLRAELRIREEHLPFDGWYPNLSIGASVMLRDGVDLWLGAGWTSRTPTSPPSLGGSPARAASPSTATSTGSPGSLGSTPPRPVDLWHSGTYQVTAPGADLAPATDIPSRVSFQLTVERSFKQVSI